MEHQISDLWSHDVTLPKTAQKHLGPEDIDIDIESTKHRHRQPPTSSRPFQSRSAPGAAAYIRALSSVRKPGHPGAASCMSLFGA